MYVYVTPIRLDLPYTANQFLFLVTRGNLTLVPTRCLLFLVTNGNSTLLLCLGPGLGRGRRHYAIVLRVKNRN